MMDSQKHTRKTYEKHKTKSDGGASRQSLVEASLIPISQPSLHTHPKKIWESFKIKIRDDCKWFLTKIQK